MTTKTFAITAPIGLVARIGHGSLQVTAVDGLTEATVTCTARPESAATLQRMTVELQGSSLHIAAPRHGGIFNVFGGRTLDAVDIEVTVPSGTPIKASSFTAEIRLAGRVGPADIATGSAGVVADFVDGDLRLRIGSADCRIDRISGSVQARSGSGTVHIGEVAGSLSSLCGNGGLDVHTALGPVRFRTGSGTASLGAIHGDVDVASGAGELTIGVPAGVSARLDLTSGSGHVDSQLPVSRTGARAGRPIAIRARTGSGDVHLVRAVA